MGTPATRPPLLQDLRLTERPVESCGCGASGHRLLEIAGGPEGAHNDNSRASRLTRGRMRESGLIDLTEGAAGGWSPDMWLAHLTPAGRFHLAEALGRRGTHIDGCGGAVGGDGVCASCGEEVPLTIEAARRRIEMLEGEEREREIWASRFSCPTHGRCRWRMVTTKKTCAICGDLLIRHLDAVV